MKMSASGPAHPNPLRVSLSGMGFQGAAVGRVDGQVVFVNNGLPGEEVLVEVKRDRRSHLEGRAVEVVLPSPRRVEPPCPYFGECGGCQWQHIDYQYQVEIKTGVVREQLERIGKFVDPPVRMALPSSHPWDYRNHARFTVDEQGRLGFVGTDYRFVPIARCLIMHPWINDTLARLQNRCKGLHQVALRYGVSSGQWLIQPSLRPVMNDAPASGQAYYQDELLGRRFQVSGASFFQVNTEQAEVLVKTVEESLALSGCEILLDAYAGVGTFAILLASDAREVIAVEESAAAIQDARLNAEGVENLRIIQGKVEYILPALEETPHAAILDPPRAGCHRRVLDALCARLVPRLVYVSCDPATLARDLRILCDGGYRLLEVQPIDMFPQTYHIETVSTLVRG